jgi:outer membrane protein OmpA-like peptidoglycan-associated protein
MSWRVRAAALVTLAGGAALFAVLTPAVAAPPSPPPPIGHVPEGAVAASVTHFTVERHVIHFTVERSVTHLVQEKKNAGSLEVTVGSDVLFAFGSDELTSEAVTELAELAARIPKAAAVDVDGHTDSIGTPSANFALSERRARAVAAQLRSARPDLKLTATGHGEAEPVQPNESGGKDNPTGRAANRRVVVSFPS